MIEIEVSFRLEFDSKPYEGELSMLCRLKENFKRLIRDRFYEMLMFLCVLIYVFYSIHNIHAGIVPTHVQEESFPWNTQILLDSNEPARTVKMIEKNDIHYGKKVSKTCLQDDHVMFRFERDPDRKVQLLVFNIYGEYLYGYWVYIEDRVQVGLSPCYEGILLFDYKEKDGGRCPVTVLTPNGNCEKKWFAYMDNLGFASEAYIDCTSDYEAVKEDGKYVIRDRESSENTAVFDFSQTPTN